MPIGADNSRPIEIVSRSPEETRAIGKALGAHASPGDVVLLVGDLGTGKTCLAQGILWGLGIDEYARSPTFVLVAQYRGRLPLYHIDLYRLDSIDAIADLGLDESLFGSGVCVVEWAEKAPEIYPEQHMTIKLDYVDDTTRRLSLISTGPRYDAVMEAMKSALAKS